MDHRVEEKSLHFEVMVPASLEEVWHAWTTEEGVKTFFAPDCNIELRPDGPYEIFFNPGAPPGDKGGDGLRVMAIDPMMMISFTWNAPPSLPEVRGQRTHVILRFFAGDDQSTRLSLHHDGWGTGGQWDEAYEYFANAWGKIILPRLRFRFFHGPVDWESPPDTETLLEFA